MCENDLREYDTSLNQNSIYPLLGTVRVSPVSFSLVSSNLNLDPEDEGDEFDVCVLLVSTIL